MFYFEIQGDFYSDRRNERLRRIALLKSFCEQCFKKIVREYFHFSIIFARGKTNTFSFDSLEFVIE